jgi:hypothetical protein
VCYVVQPVNDRRRVIALLPYQKMPDTDELRFVTDERLSYILSLDYVDRNKVGLGFDSSLVGDKTLRGKYFCLH